MRDESKLLREAKERFASLVWLETLAKAKPEVRYQILEYVRRANSNAELWLGILKRTLLDKTDREKAFLALVDMLFLIETSFACLANLIIYALILKEHHDIWDEYRQKFVVTFDDVVELTLFVKLEFLKKHNFGFLANICPRDLRNAIIHNYFEIDSEGSVDIIKKGKRVEVVLEELTDKAATLRDVLLLGFKSMLKQ